VVGSRASVKQGKALVTLACPHGTRDCAGKLVLRSTAKRPKTFGSASFAIAIGKRRVVAVRLSAQALRLLATTSNHRLRTRATLGKVTVSLMLVGGKPGTRSG
jgi:hypothetical protein